MTLTKLNGVREARRLTFEDLSKLSGVSQGTIRRIEKGKGCILANAKALAKALRLELGELI